MDDPSVIADRSRAELAPYIDRQMAALGDAVLDRLALAPGHRVLDIGCGAGATTVDIARRVGVDGHVTGVDVGPQVLAVARTRTCDLPQVTLLLADAARLSLPSHTFDTAFSRFGVMFFSQPEVAFRNLKRLLKPGGMIGFVCWRSLAENELDHLCVEAARLPIAHDAAPHEFTDAAVIEAVLAAAGFVAIEVVAHDARIVAGDAAVTTEVALRVGALGKALRTRPDLRAIAEPRVLAALTARERDAVVELGAATWIVTART